MAIDPSGSARSGLAGLTRSLGLGSEEVGRGGERGEQGAIEQRGPVGLEGGGSWSGLE
jgi:hypothetical protein